MSVRLLPDIEGIVVTYLKAHSDLAEFTGTTGKRVYGDLPENVVFPAVSIERVGGRPEPGDPAGYLDHAVLRIFAWAQDRDTAFDVCATALGALHEIPQIAEGLGVVTAVQDLIGPRPLPDPDTKAFRYLAEVLVTAHPLPAGS